MFNNDDEDQKSKIEASDEPNQLYNSAYRTAQFLSSPFLFNSPKTFNTKINHEY